MTYIRRRLGLLTACAIAASLFPAAITTGASSVEAAPLRVPSAAVSPTQAEGADLIAALKLIDEIPIDILRTDAEARRQWIRQVHPELLKSSRASMLGCAGAIAVTIASTAFPVAKILKIKRLIASLGGVYEAVKLFRGATFSYEKIRALGGAAAALGAELLGVTQIRQQCFR